MRPSVWRIAAQKSCLTNFDWGKKKEVEEEKEKQCQRTLKEMC